MRGNPPLLLAIDTSTRTVGLALYDGAQVLSESIWSGGDYHTVELAPAVAESFSRAGASLEALSIVAVATGPGSFTGLRVGMALAKGLVLARKLALVGVPTLDALASAQPAVEMPLLAVLRAGRGRLALAEYHCTGNTWSTSGKIEVVTIEALAEKITTPTLISGELSEEERRRLTALQPLARLASPAASLRRPSYLAEIAWKRWRAGQIDSPATLAPIYIHYNDPIPV